MLLGVVTCVVKEMGVIGSAIGRTFTCAAGYTRILTFACRNHAYRWSADDAAFVIWYTS